MEKGWVKHLDKEKHLYEQIVTKEDLVEKIEDCVAVAGYLQGGMPPSIMSNVADLGYIDVEAKYLGADLIINYVKLYNDKEMSDKLTKEMKGKILLIRHAF